jgi:homoserine dehydrogenase
MNSQSLRIGIAGLGTVGQGVVSLLQTHAELIARRAGKPIEIIAVSARDKKRSRSVDVSRYEWIDDPLKLAADPRIDVVIEVIGGADSIAKQVVETALKNGKTVITANKALLAHHGLELTELAEKHNGAILYEAAVAGGIPAIKALREGYAANDIASVRGILNGTSNYILTTMRETGRDFAAVLKEAQDKGYAEADPSFDIDGIDAAHKLSLLTAVAFGVRPDFSTVRVCGISHLTAQDIAFAGELGYRIKLLGIAKKTSDGISQSVEPCLVSVDNPLAAIEGVYNAVFVEGDFIGNGMLSGRGAGAVPTASAIGADLIDVAQGYRLPTFGVPVKNLAPHRQADQGAVESRFYVHMVALDRPGVLAAVSTVLRDHGVSIEVVIQRGRDPDRPVSLVMTTHATPYKKISDAADAIGALEQILHAPTVLRIE